MVSDGSGSMLSSTVEITPTGGLSGEVECLSGLNVASLSVLASVNISVAGEVTRCIFSDSTILMQPFPLPTSPWWSKRRSTWQV